jgi:hypothetical protein
MYRFITRHCEQIVDSIPLDHVTDYKWLLCHKSESGTADYRRRFRLYWAMNAAQLSGDFYDSYFELLSRPSEPPLNIRQVSHTLFHSAVRRNGTKVLPFSFVTKLMHMRDQRTPIYDSQVAKFFFFEAPDSTGEVESRIERLIGFHEFLAREYRRVLDEALQGAVSCFMERFREYMLTEEKVVDSLIWKTVALLTSGALEKGQMHYE